MKLMGTLNLQRFARDEAREAGVIAALLGELSDTVWCCCDDVVRQFPTASVEGNRIRIYLDSGHCIDLIASYQRGMIMIEYVGLIEKAPRLQKRGRRRAA